jgi:hypothetical protein
VQRVIGVGEVASSNPGVVSTSPSGRQQEWITGKGEKFENRLLRADSFIFNELSAQLWVRLAKSTLYFASYWTHFLATY